MTYVNINQFGGLIKRRIVAFNIQKYPDQGILLIKKMSLLTNSN